MDISKFNAWLDEFVGDPTTPEGRAVNLAYKSSMPDRVLGKGWNTPNAKQARKNAAAEIAKFLQNSAGKTSNVLWDDIVRPNGLWDEVRNIHKNCGLTQYTYGNAQKWVAMSIKYYLVAKYHNTPNALCNDVLADVVFPIDRIMINKIQSGKVVAGTGSNISISVNNPPPSPSWSKCDCKQKFIDYIDAVKNELIKFPTQDKLIEFEINNW